MLILGALLDVINAREAAKGRIRTLPALEERLAREVQAVKVVRLRANRAPESYAGVCDTAFRVVSAWADRMERR
jgi:hypothetical protein